MLKEAEEAAAKEKSLVQVTTDESELLAYWGVDRNSL